MSLLNYTFKRLLATIPILFFVLFITFILVRMTEGSPYGAGAVGGNIDPEWIAQMEENAGFNDPVLIQFGRFLRDLILKGYWGESISTSPGQPVWSLMWGKVPKTLEMNIITTFVSSYIGIKMGVFSAVNHNNYKDNLMRFFSFIFYSMPVFWLAIILKSFLSGEGRLFPTQGYIDDVYSSWIRQGGQAYVTGFAMIDTLITGYFGLWWDIMKHMFLPILVMIVGSMAGLTRYVRSSMLETLELDYIRSARAKGCKEKDVINKHALRNSMIPTVTLIGMNFGFLFTGSTLIEYTFNISGMGTLYLQAMQNRDYFLIQALVILVTASVMIANLITDLLYGVLDPRIRL